MQIVLYESIYGCGYLSRKNLSHIFPKSSVVDFRSPSIEFNAFSSSAILNVDEKGFFYLLSCNTL